MNQILAVLYEVRRCPTTHSTQARDSMAFMLDYSGVCWVLFARAGLIRALGTPESSDMKASRKNLLLPHAAALRRSNYSLNRSAS
jgi:hypothetical protein